MHGPFRFREDGYLAVVTEEGCPQDDGIGDEDDTNHQQAVHTVVLNLHPPGPHYFLSLTLTQDLYNKVNSIYKLQQIFTFVIKLVASDTAIFYGLYV